MKKLVSRQPLPYQIFLSVLTISILSAIQFATIDKTCLAQCPCTVTCTVEDKSDGSPIPQAIVKLVSDEETLVGITDDDGVVVFTDVGLGTYDITADAQCYEKGKKKDRLINGDDAFTFKLKAVGTNKQGDLSGFVKDGRDGVTPINGADVKIEPYGPTEQTVEDGSYVFDCIEANTEENPYKVSADADGYVGKTKTDVVVDAGVSTTLDFELFPPNIKGEVTDFVTSDPIPDALVEALRDSTVAGSTETNNKGKYSIFLDPDTYIIRGSKFGYLPHEEEVTLEEELENNFSLTACEATLEGKVEEKGTGEPLGDATVRITDPAVENPETKTDDEGKYKFDKQCLTSGETYTVEAEKCGYKTKEETIESALALPDKNKLNFKLPFVEECTTTTTTTTTQPTTTTTVPGTTTTTQPTTTTTVPGTTTTTQPTTTTTVPGTTTTTTIPPGECAPCEGEPATITFSISEKCTSFSFAIGGESGPRTENLIYKRAGRRICGTVTYTNSGNTYCVDITVRRGFWCILSVSGTATLVED